MRSAQTVLVVLSLLTGLDAGSADQSGEYPSGTLNARIAERLRALAAIRRDFSHAQRKSAEKDDD